MASSPAEGVSIRTIRLKVLYTFDVEQKDNHLARWPHPMEVQTAFVDDLNQIGVIDLRTCLEAITTASPELTTHPENDYTVYAYDYSEPDTPLVGQGMLSRALTNQGQGAPGDNEAMVTGKLTKNVMGLFSKNAQEMLEVRLRLTPVSAFPQIRYRSGSVGSQDGSRPQWSNASSTQTMPSSTSPVDTSGLEAMQRMLSRENGQSSGPISRPGTPNASQILNAPSRQAGTSSRPSSRAGMRQTTAHARRDSFNSGYYSGDETIDEGPTRKRAKITKVDWPTKSDLNIERQPESLRVAASIASSVRLQRPIAINPATTAQGILSLEEPVRPPTPVPASKSGKLRGRPERSRRNPPSNLVHGAQIRGSSPSADSVPRPDLLNIPIASPEDTRARSVSSTPANIPSSPPVMPEQHHSLITSPALPPLADHGHDSGFLSETLDELFGDDQTLRFDDFIVDKPDGQGDYETRERNKNSSNPYPLVFEDGNGFDDQSAIQPKPNMIPPSLPISSRPLARAQSYTPAPRTSMSSPRLAPAPIPRARQIMEEQRDQQRMKTIAPAPLPKSDPSSRTFQRSQTWAPDSDALMSDVPTTEESRAKAASRKKVGKEQTKARLEAAIANGEMPPFCDNCGCIETPAWRRAYAKTFDCAWDDVETSLDQGECCYKEILEHNPDGSVKTFRGYKVEKRSGDEADEWMSITLCNPCGLWFHKQKCPRPPEKWQKKDPREKGKRKRNSNSSKNVKKANGNSNLKSDAQTPASDDSSPADTATEAPDAEENEKEAPNNDDYMVDDVEPQLPPMPHTFRASSADPRPRGLQTGFRHRVQGRQIQSSPGQPHGSEGVPIEIDLTPKPVRRQLFPSPDKVQVRSDPGLAAFSSKAITNLPTFVRRSPRLMKTRDAFTLSAGMVELAVDGKENVPPASAPPVADDGLADLFEEGPVDVELPPMTPTPKRRSERLLMQTPSKTPQRQFGAGLSPNAELRSTFRTPKAKSSTHPALTALLGTAHKDVLEMTPFSRSIHDALTSDLPLPLDLPEEDKTLPRGSSKKNTPNKVICFDFPDLPSLKNSSPMSNEHLINFSFSELTTDQLHSDGNDPFRTNATMPSSPPPGLFSFLDTHEHSLWDGLLSTNGLSHEGQSTYPDPDPEGTTGTTKLAQPARRSPRKQQTR